MPYLFESATLFLCLHRQREKKLTCYIIVETRVVHEEFTLSFALGSTFGLGLGRAQQRLTRVTGPACNDTINGR
jgi:hypothetical protein